MDSRGEADKVANNQSMRSQTGNNKHQPSYQAIKPYESQFGEQLRLSSS
jgi:hypothetical protein